MFSGLVETTGEVTAVDNVGDAVRISISGRHILTDARLGDSIAVNGVCLTVSELDAASGVFVADVMQESLNRSSLGDLRPGSAVNLERALRADARLGGHIMQGHVDGTATLVSRTASEHWDVLRFQLPEPLVKYVVEKGSIAVSGVSLTVSAISDAAVSDTATADAAAEDAANSQDTTRSTAQHEVEHWFEVSLIPTTLAETTLGQLAVGKTVNLEVDIIGKYVEKLLAAGTPTSYNFPSDTH
ncbi:riboflavin synthase [Corynebacterium propinquum]|uniref:Riboflavin synthase n=1 Tax=Corynebacterium propinquum TaxID=43769 RepID=A0ABT7G0L2_9CORY|nr:riboflavin synthase [Corynebacterium propinquum]MDK4238009.1 riboflavin synthase [Corynebacterium propinquum]MDK4299742.1 riboflavin synthase [Corynebacterium propinquum]MDK4312469.1 riboflavin synthase [Corynebacterium propinquum]RUP80441.1 riboflavin synthase [Corynebacterium propinquum]RUP90665.1 riboflavin synthase [Corynebacterium propinquum]